MVFNRLGFTAVLWNNTVNKTNIDISNEENYHIKNIKK